MFIHSDALTLAKRLLCLLSLPPKTNTVVVVTAGAGESGESRDLIGQVAIACCAGLLLVAAALLYRHRLRRKGSTYTPRVAHMDFIPAPTPPASLPPSPPASPPASPCPDHSDLTPGARRKSVALTRLSL